MRWVTIIIGAIRVTQSDIDSDAKRQVICAEVAEMVSGYRATWTGLSRGRRLSGATWRGSVEIDLRRAIEPGGHCQSTLASIGVDASPLGPDERILIVHAHLVLAADALASGDTGGEVWADAVRQTMRDAWPGRWRVVAKGLWADQPVRQAITRLYGYVHKRRLQYADGGWGDVPTRFGSLYEPPWYRLVSDAYRGMETELRSRR